MSEQAPSIESFLDDGELTGDAWANALEAGVILGQQCDSCGHATAAPKAACGQCGSRDIRVIELPQTGDVFSVTKIEVAPVGHDESYSIGIVTLGNARILARVPDGVSIGDEVTFDDVLPSDDYPSPVFT